MARELILKRDGVRLGGLDFGGDGRAALLLHGLAGHAGEWTETARWLTETCRVVALDARGHGTSERFPASVSLDAQVADAACAIEQLRLDPALVIGQSLGGRVALLLASERSDLVRGLVVADASPEGSGDAEAVEALVTDVTNRLRWPVPFDSREAAIAFFGGPSLSAEAWVAGLEHRDGGWWPRFDVEVMARTLRDAVSRCHWDAWERIQCPVLVVRAGNGVIPAADARAMAARGRNARLAELADAEHDLHLDRPAEWRALVSEFVDSIPAKS